jgi:hypothetical protein
LEDLLGKWSGGQLHFDDHDEQILVFEENGRGFLTWGDEEYGRVNTFNWTINNGILKATGIKEFRLEDGELAVVADAEPGVFEGEVFTYREQALDGSFIPALEFSKRFLGAFHKTFGFVNREIYDSSDWYLKLKNTLWD